MTTDNQANVRMESEQPAMIYVRNVGWVKESLSPGLGDTSKPVSSATRPAVGAAPNGVPLHSPNDNVAPSPAARVCECCKAPLPKLNHPILRTMCHACGESYVRSANRAGRGQ